MSDPRRRTPTPDSEGGATARLDGVNLPEGLPGKFRILRVLGRGGNGIVVEAEDRLLGRRVAVKLLPEKTAIRPEALQRFLREARASASLVHPHVVTLFEIEEHQDAYYLVMELAPEGSVQQRLDERGPIPWREATRIIADTCRGLIAAHAAGLVHRDIKPANLLCFPGDVTKLADFGLAKALDPNALSITDVGTVLGTPHYMSPEQWRGDRLDGRADLYALGATYYTLLTGETPFQVSEALQIMYAHCSANIPDPQTVLSSLPSGCTGVVRRSMSKSPADRYPSAEAFLADLEHLLASSDGRLASEPPRPLRRRPRWIAIGLAAGLLLTLLLFVILRPDKKPVRPETTTWLWPDNPLVTPGAIGAVAVSTDPPLLAWAFEETADVSTVSVWDPRTGTIRHRLKMKGAPKSLVFAPDGATLAATGSDSGKVWRWNTSSGKEAVALEVPSSGGQCLAFSSDQRYLAQSVTPWNQKEGVGVQVWELATGKRVTLEKPHQGACDAVVFIPDSTILIAATKNGTLPRWDAATGKALPSLRIDTGYVNCLAISGDGQFLVGGVAPGRGERLLHVWNARTGEARPSLQGHRGDIFGVAFAPDQRTLASAGTDAIYLWNVETGQALKQVLQSSEAAVIRAVVFAPDGPTLLRGGFDKRLLRYSLDEIDEKAP